MMIRLMGTQYRHSTDYEEPGDSWRLVGKQEVMVPIGSPGITSALPVIQTQS